MEALLDFFDPTEVQHPPSNSSGQDPLPPSLPPEVRYKILKLIRLVFRWELCSFYFVHGRWRWVMWSTN